MIKRNYFYSGLVNLSGGLEMHFNGIVSTVSWLPHPLEVLDRIISKNAEEAKVQKGSVRVITMVRI